MTMAMWFVLFGLASVVFGIFLGIWIGGVYPRVTDFLFPYEEMDDEDEEEPAITMTKYHE